MIHKRCVACRRQSAPRNVFKPTLEAMEDRAVPSVDITYGGGPTIPHAQVTNIVAGTQLLDTTALMKAILKDYLPLLGPNYGIGAGTFQGSVTVSPFPSNPTSAQVENLISSEIQSGAVPAPGPSQLYVVFLQPSQWVSDVGLPYHNQFYDSSLGQYVTYAVASCITTASWATSDFASHEVAEAVTDPDGSTGWYDRNIRANGGLNYGEVADIYSNVSYDFTMDGYTFNMLSGPQGQMIPTQSPPPSLPSLQPPPPSPRGGGGSATGGGGINLPTFFQAAIALYIDGIETILQGDSAAHEQSIQTNLPYAAFAGIDLGEFFVLSGELAAYNALHGNNNGGQP